MPLGPYVLLDLRLRAHALDAEAVAVLETARARLARASS